MHTLAAYYESVDPAGALVNIAAVPDTHLFISGDDIRVPVELPNVIGEIALTAEINLLAARLSSPSLRAITLLDMEPVIAAVVFGSPPEAIMHPLSPTPLAPFEALNLLISSDPAAPGPHYGLIWLGDGPQPPINGQIYTIKATAAATLAAGAWVNSSLTFTQALPVGRYQVVGMRARGANLVAARLVFVGGIFRPGVPAVNAISDLDADWFRYGGIGVFGEFDSVTPPTLDCLGTVDTAQNLIFDLIRIA